MNLITITDEMLNSALIEESDKENLKKARGYGKDKMQINLESTIFQAFIRELTFDGLNYLFDQIKKQNSVQSFKSGEVISLARSVNVLEEKLKEISSFKDENYMVANPGEFLRGFKAAIDELNEIYLKSLDLN